MNILSLCRWLSKSPFAHITVCLVWFWLQLFRCSLIQTLSHYQHKTPWFQNVYFGQVWLRLQFALQSILWQWLPIFNGHRWRTEKRLKIDPDSILLLQASPVVQVADSQRRAVIILEVPPPPTTTHMQASTVRQGHLTGTTCQIFILSKFNWCKIQRPDGPNLVVRDNGQLMGEKATRNCLQKSWD